MAQWTLIPRVPYNEKANALCTMAIQAPIPGPQEGVELGGSAGKPRQPWQASNDGPKELRRGAWRLASGALPHLPDRPLLARTFAEWYAHSDRAQRHCGAVAKARACGSCVDGCRSYYREVAR